MRGISLLNVREHEPESHRDRSVTIFPKWYAGRHESSHMFYGGGGSECFNKSWVGRTMQASSTNSWPSCGRLWEPPTVVTVQVFVLIVVAAGAYVDWVLPVCQPLCRDFFPWTSLHAKFLMGQVYYYSHLTAKETKAWMVDWSPNVMQVQNGGALILKQAFWPPSTCS